jgi:hypothetical protein
MGKLLLFLLAVAAAVPAAAQIPISGIGGAGSGREAALRRQWLGADDRLEPDRDPRRGAELLGQLRQVDRRIERQRDNGQISRGEARRAHREAARIGSLYSQYSGNGLSTAEAAELQTRIQVLAGIPIANRQAGPRQGR